MPLLRLLARLPLWLVHVLGGGLGWLAYALSAAYRRGLRENAGRAGITPAARRASVAEAGRLVMELPRLWLRPRERAIDDPVHWQGETLIEQCVAQPGGLLLLTPHIGSFEVAAQAFSQRFGQRKPLTVLYRPARQRWLRELEETARARDHLATAPATLAGVRQLLRALRRGETAGMLPDQVPPQGQGAWAPFFGHPAYTMTLAARLVQQTGAAVIVLWCERLPHGRGYVVHVEPLAEPLPAGASDEALAAAMNRSMEAVILRCPAQYLWGYARYKAPRGAA